MTSEASRPCNEFGRYSSDFLSPCYFPLLRIDIDTNNVSVFMVKNVNVCVFISFLNELENFIESIKRGKIKLKKIVVANLQSLLLHYYLDKARRNPHKKLPFMSLKKL